MATRFCTICERLGESEGRLCCEAFPFGIPEAIYPNGCQLRGATAKGKLFGPRRDRRRLPKRWGDLSKVFLQAR